MAERKPPSRSVRLSQALAPFGVGAVLDILGESFVACDTSLWKGTPHQLRLRRLEEELGVANFRRPPVRHSIFGQTHEPGVPYFRFPRWLFCASRSCRRMTRWEPRWDRDSDGAVAQCPHCHSRRALVPMRLVAVCKEGHLDDVPWDYWAHSGSSTPAQRQCRAQALIFKTRPSAGTGLASLVVRCVAPGCGAERSLAGITDKGSLAKLGLTCRGIQPWQLPSAGQPHGDVPEVVQRGATNVHFAHIESALDIPPESRYSEFGAITLKITQHLMFEMLLSAIGQPTEELLVDAIAKGCEVTSEQVRAVVRDEAMRRGLTAPKPAHEADIQTGEWLAFTGSADEYDERDRFITKHVSLGTGSMSQRAADVSQALLATVDQVVLATKLREVRALVGFSRYDPTGKKVAPDLKGNMNWLPAIEVYGEGVFLTLREDAVHVWETGPAAARVRALEERRSASHLSGRLPSASPRFVLLHTLAHLLIRQLAFGSGYASASLRERIYSRAGEGDQAQAGLLIYTAAGDAEGTLGGLVRQGEPDRLVPTLLATLEQATWCSNDPICRDSLGQGLNALNKAACHACALLPETSCVYSNALLDRSLVVGSPVPGESFLESSLRLALDAM